MVEKNKRVRYFVSRQGSTAEPVLKGTLASNELLRGYAVEEFSKGAWKTVRFALSSALLGLEKKVTKEFAVEKVEFVSPFWLWLLTLKLKIFSTML